MTVDLVERVAQLERRLHRQRIVGIAGMLVIAALALTAFTSHRETIVRAQGIVIEDAQGRPRLLIGAPIPSVSERRRTDAASGIVILDSSGRDRLALGEYGGPQINGQVVRRVAPAVGLLLNDGHGNERGGFAVQDNGTINLGLDTPDGREIASFFYTPHEGAAILFGSEAGAGYDRALLGVFATGNQAIFKLSDTLNGESLVLKAKGRNQLQVFARDSGYRYREIPSPFKP